MNPFIQAILASAVVIFALIAIVLIGFQIFNFLRLSKQKEHFAQVHKQLKPGVEVMLTSGLYGTVRKVTEEYVMVELAEHLQIKASRFSIREIVKE